MSESRPPAPCKSLPRDGSRRSVCPFLQPPTSPVKSRRPWSSGVYTTYSPRAYGSYLYHLRGGGWDVEPVWNCKTVERSVERPKTLCLVGCMVSLGRSHKTFTCRSGPVPLRFSGGVGRLHRWDPEGTRVFTGQGRPSTRLTDRWGLVPTGTSIPRRRVGSKGRQVGRQG